MRDLKIFNHDDFPKYLPKLNSLYDDLFSSGKGFRSKLIQRIGKHLSLSERQELLLAQTIEFIHNASLLHDDLIDRSHLRRSKTAAWLKYSPEYAVLAGDYLLARVMVNLSRYGNLRLIQYTAEMISDLLEGEWIQDSLVRDWNVQLNQLDQVHDLKTASLFKWCLRAPFIAKDNQNEELHQTLAEMGALLGLLFQRGDDLLDFDIRNDEGKALLGDLKSGYLNSFAAFLARDFSENKKQTLRQCQELGQVKELVGIDRFNQAVHEFDEMNKQVIELYEHKADSLRPHLKPEERGLINDLMGLPSLLYFRRAK
ncbi:MAG TPA: polyprenyl synthetase family protein [Bdellovibrionales bacterium]|nr:polyprenyl synthetase family protein [Bdellovibrionales bacterium]